MAGEAGSALAAVPSGIWFDSGRWPICRGLRMPIRIRAQADADDVARLVRALAAIDRKLAKKLLRKAVLTGGRIVRDEAKSLVPIRTGTLRKSIGAKVKSYPSRRVVVAIVGPRRGFRKDIEGVGTVDPVNYAHLVEFGSRRSQAKPFMRPAWDENVARIREAMAQILIEGMANR
jgi:HK97 gp10 family phage protein